MLDLVAFCVALPFDRNPDHLSAVLEMWMWHPLYQRNVEVPDDQKIFLGNLKPVSDHFLRGWLRYHGWRFPIPPKLVPKGDLVMALRASGTVLCRRPSFWDGDGVEVVRERAIVLARRGSGYRGYGDCRARNSGRTICEVLGGGISNSLCSWGFPSTSRV